MPASPSSHHPPSIDVFSSFVDHDGDMKLDFEEFVAMQPIKIREVCTREQIREWYDKADINNDGRLTVNEFFQWSLGAGGSHEGARNGKTILEDAFKRYDTDGGGTLSGSEFKQMARDMGFGYAASEAFAVLDEDGSGTISYKELLASLDMKIPTNLETKKLLFGCIWSWGVGEADASDTGRNRVDTSRWKIKGETASVVYSELRTLLRDSGAHVSELGRLFDEDSGSGAPLTIDAVEFVKVIKRWGFRGMPHVLEEVFATVNTSGSERIDYDEFFEYVRGHRHALDARTRNAMVRELSVDVPAGSNFTMSDIAWNVEPSAGDAVESLRILMQHTLLTSNVAPYDLMRAWDRSGDKTLDKREFTGNIKRLCKRYPELWTRELKRVADAAFIIIQDDGSDVDAKAMDVIELEQWLYKTTKRKPEALLPLKQRRHHGAIGIDDKSGPQKPAPAPPRPGCDIPSRATEAIEAAKKTAAARLQWLETCRTEQTLMHENRTPPPPWLPVPTARVSSRIPGVVHRRPSKGGGGSKSARPSTEQGGSSYAASFGSGLLGARSSGGGNPRSPRSHAPHRLPPMTSRPQSMNEARSAPVKAPGVPADAAAESSMGADATGVPPKMMARPTAAPTGEDVAGSRGARASVQPVPYVDPSGALVMPEAWKTMARELFASPRQIGELTSILAKMKPMPPPGPRAGAPRPMHGRAW